MPAILMIFCVALGTTVGPFLLTLIYNVYLHPLRSFPGPKLWSATQLVWLYYRITGQLVDKSVELHKKYGTVVRVTPNQLTYTTESAWKSIYGHRPVEMQKNVLSGFSKPGIPGAHAILSADKQNHARLRRILAPTFTEKYIRDHESTILRYVDQLVSKLQAHCDRGQVDMNKYFEWTTMDLIADLLCGQPDGALDKEDGGPWLNILTNSIQGQVLFQALDSLGLTRWRAYLLPRDKLNAPFSNFKTIAGKFETRASQLTEADANSADYIFDRMMKEKAALSPIEMRLNSATIIGAGTGTTATWLSTNVHSITTNPGVHAKLKHEIREAFDSDSGITHEQVAKLPYLAAVMQESLRIHCPSPSATGRIVPAGGEVIDGVAVPGGTTVGVHQHAAYHSPSNFRNADDFCPERWLPEGRLPESPFCKDNLSVVNPFSYGPRTCLGIKLTHFETRMILAKLIWHFDIQLMAESTGWQATQKATVAWHRTPLYCKVSHAR